MGKKMRLQQFMEATYVGDSIPDRRTVLARFERGEYPGYELVFEGIYYVQRTATDDDWAAEVFRKHRAS